MSRELTRQEKAAIRSLVKRWCANYDKDIGCLPLDCECYMLGKCWTGAYCRYFRDAVLPNDPVLEAALTAEGPVPEHDEPMESPFKKSIMSAQRVNPALHTFCKDMNPIANASPDFPLVMTTYSCTEHWCTGAFTRWQPWLVEAQPQAYVEISEELAKEKGIANGEKVRISSARGTVDAVAMVTGRLTPCKCGGKTGHQVGMTFNYGWLQPKECGDTANLLSPMVGDANSMTPEYKAFMVNIDKIKA